MMNKVWKGEQMAKNFVKGWLYRWKVEYNRFVCVDRGNSCNLLSGLLDCGFLVRIRFFETDYCEVFKRPFLDSSRPE